MKKNPLFLIFFLLAGIATQAQLASEKPLNTIYSRQAKAKLNEPKNQASTARPLPSEAPLPKAVTDAGQHAHQQKAAVVLSDEEKKKRLPSNSKKMIPSYKRPKRP